MLDILRLAMTKKTLSKMTPEERSLFLLLGYASNQVNALWKLVIITTNSTPDDPIEQRVSGAQTQSAGLTIDAGDKLNFEVAPGRAPGKFEAKNLQLAG